MKLQTITITPEMAEEFLNRSEQAGGLNRLKRAHIDRLQREMVAGRFILNGEPIIIATSGKILDGHHRLRAALEGKCSFTTVLETEADETILGTIDQGSSRNVADTLSLSGHKGPKGSLGALGKAVAWIINYQAHGSPFREMPPNYVIEEWVRNHQDLEEPCANWVESVNEAIRIPKPLIAFTFLEGVLNNQREATEMFLEKLATGAGLAAGDPELILRNFFMQEYVKLVHSRNKKMRPTQHTILGRVLKCLRASIDGTKMEKLTFAAREALPDLHQTSFESTTEVSATIPPSTLGSGESNQGTEASL